MVSTEPHYRQPSRTGERKGYLTVSVVTDSAARDGPSRENSYFSTNILGTG